MSFRWVALEKIATEASDALKDITLNKSLIEVSKKAKTKQFMITSVMFNLILKFAFTMLASFGFLPIITLTDNMFNLCLFSTGLIGLGYIITHVYDTQEAKKFLKGKIEVQEQNNLKNLKYEKEERSLSEEIERKTELLQTRTFIKCTV